MVKLDVCGWRSIILSQRQLFIGNKKIHFSSKFLWICISFACSLWTSWILWGKIIKQLYFSYYLSNKPEWKFLSYEYYLGADKKDFLKTLRFYSSHSLFFMTSKLNLFKMKTIIPRSFESTFSSTTLDQTRFGHAHWEGLLSCFVLPLPLTTLLDCCHPGTGPQSNGNTITRSFFHEKICGLFENSLELPAALFSDGGKPLLAHSPPQLLP